MNNLLKKLPYDMNMIILEYEGSVKNRNGVFMNQISKNDYRYSVLLDIPEKKQFEERMAGIFHMMFVLFLRRNHILHLFDSFQKKML